MATKKDMSNAAETLAESIAVAHGATIVTEKIKVGGKMTDTRVAKDGMFDLDTCRGLAIKALHDNRELLIGHTAKLLTERAASVNDGTGPRVGPNGKVTVGAPESR